MRIWAAVSGVGVVISLFALPGSAIAKGHNFVIGPSQTMEFHLKGSNGFSISVFGSGGDVSLTARHGGSSASYSTRGFVSPARLKARFGHLGRVSVRFHSATGPQRVLQTAKDCHGKGEVVDRGQWVGRIEFQGEQAYTTVHASRARGKVIKTPKRTCSLPETEGSYPNLRVTFLHAASQASGASFAAFKVTSSTYPKFDTAVFTASLLELRGRRLFIDRSISVNTEADAFASIGKKNHIESATIAPPAPFKGTATFQRTNGSEGSWSGSLVGDFPGRGEVALAGLEFSAEIQG
jgi:hypothetical protein